MIKWFYYWDEWRKAYWNSIDKYPELFAFLHRMYVFQHQRESGSVDANDAVFRAGARTVPVWALKKLRDRSACRGRPTGATHTSAVSKNDDEAVDIDVLFDTRVARDTCLGVGEKLFAKMREKNPEIKGAFYQNGRRRVLPCGQHAGCPVITLDQKLTGRGILRFLRLLPVVYLHGFKSSAVVRMVFLHPLIIWVNLLKITTLSVAVERMLDRIRPKIIISCNEQGGADATVLFALARRKGILTIQYMHAAPTKQFVPFISNEFWSWSELTTDMLLGETTDPRVINLGSLEHENQARVSTPGRKAESEEPVRVLFLAQAGMDEAWGIHSVERGVQLLKAGIQKFEGEVELRVREHPSANAQRRSILKKLFSDIPYELTTKEIPLEEDIKWATHVYAVSSNAIFAGLLGGKPSYLLWNDELNEIYGRCFLPDENVVSNQHALLRSLKTFDCPIPPQESLSELLGPLGALDRAVDRIQQLVEAC